MTKKIDTEVVRQAAKGRWLEILQSVAGMPAESLDGQHGPCLKCGGTDRFRAFDDIAETGGVICNQCHAKKNCDGFATISWMLGVTFPMAKQLVAEHLGLATSISNADPEKDLEFSPWSSDLAAFFVTEKKGTSEPALRDCGAEHAMHYGKKVIALPIIGADGPEAVGWVLVGWNGGASVPKKNPKAKEWEYVKSKLTYGSKAAGLLGRYGVERLKTPGMVELVWKVEGISDMLALQAIIPEELRDRHVVVTNPKGSKETPKWQSSILATVDCNVLHDADEPGQAGAAKWVADIAAQAKEGVEIRNVQLPYEISPTHGKDLRDWLNDGRTYTDLLALADQTAPVAVQHKATGAIDYTNVPFPIQELILKKLCLEILYEDDENHIRVFSTVLRKSSWIRKVSQLKLDDLYQMAGPPVNEHVVASASDAGDEQWTMSDVRKALGTIAATRRGKNDERGIGIWQGLNDQGNATETIVLVSDTEGARWNGDGALQKIVAPRADGLVFEYGAASGEWYKFEELAQLLERAEDSAWRDAAIDEAVNLFEKWRWRNPEIHPTLIVGLVLASWVQTVWEWRPLVAISGESNSGKSYLFEALGGSQNGRGIFGALAFKQAKSTEAGIRQGIAKSARVILCDEFEASKERTKILEALRQSTRGETVCRGTSQHRSRDFVLRHIGWVAAIETGLSKQPDANRFIQLELLTAEPGKFGELVLPEPTYLVGLGQKLLAIAVWSALEAKRLAVVLKSTKAEGVDGRTIESYGVPAAMLAVAAGYDEDTARKLLLKLLEAVDRAEQGKVDQEELLEDILSSSILLDNKTQRSVAQVLESPAMRMDHSARLEAAGLKMLDDGALFLVPKLVSHNLLRGTAWDGQKIDQILLRLPGVSRDRLRLSGSPKHGLLIPHSLHASSVNGSRGET